MTVDVTWNAAGERDFAHSQQLRRLLDAASFTITAHAVPHVGVDTGRLINSMGHKVTSDGTSLVARLGSGVQDGVAPVWYWTWHWAKQPPPGGAPSTKETRGRRIPHPTRPAPTRPYSKALRELGITFTIAPGGYET